MGTAGRRVVARLGPGEFFGEMSVIVGEARSARAAAVSGCRLLELDATPTTGGQSPLGLQKITELSKLAPSRFAFSKLAVSREVPVNVAPAKSVGA